MPRFGGTDSVLLATGILGATVMPHVIFLHSALTQGRIVVRDPVRMRALFRFELWDVAVAMGIAGLVNAAMLIMAAATFHSTGTTDVATIEEAHRTLAPLLGSAASVVFAVSLLASGLSSASVGTMAGQVIMQGFLRRGIPVWVRRLVTMLPSLVVIVARSRPDAHAGHQPGRPELRAALRRRPAGPLHAARRPDGRPGQSPRDDVRRRAGGRPHRGAEPVPDLRRICLRGEAMFKNLLVPLDGSRMAESALAAAAYLAPKLRARVTLMHCIERAAPETVHGERHLREPEEARAYLEEAAARAFPLRSRFPAIRTRRKSPTLLRPQ